MTTPVYINGRGGNVTFGGFTFSVVEWSLKVDNGLIDVTNTGSGTFGQFIAGINTGTVSMKAFWDTANSYTGTGNLKPGETGTATLLIGSSGQSVTVTAIVIMSVNLVNSPTAGVQYDIEAKLTAVPVYPS